MWCCASLQYRSYRVADAGSTRNAGRHVATLGIVCISDDPRHANEMLSKVVDFIEAERLDADVGEVDLPKLEAYVTELEQRVAFLEQRLWPRLMRAASTVIRRR